MPSSPAQNQGTGSANVVQSTKPAIGVTNQPPKKFPIVLALGAVALLLLFLVLAKYGKGKLPIGESAAAKVGSETISKAQVEQLAGDCAISQEEAVYYLVDEKVLGKWANDEKVTVTENEASTEAQRIGGPTPKDCKRTLANVNILRKRLEENTVKFKVGKFISINFDRFANPRPFVPIPGAETEEERVKRLQEDRAYADSLVESINQDLKSKKLTFEEAMEKVKSDTKVGIKSLYSTSQQSGIFTAADYITLSGLLSNTEVKKIVDSLSEQQVSEPFIQQANLALCGQEDPGCEPQIVDARWLIIKVEKIGKGYQTSGESLLKEIRSKYKAQIYQ